jgi:uncharacterized protein (DUF305 family)
MLHPRAFPGLAVAGLMLTLWGAIPASAQASHGAAHAGHGAPANTAAEAYTQAMTPMHDAMMNGVKHPDPDVAFVLGMIPHHQGAIAMAQVELKYGTDPKTRKLAAEVIEAQTREIADMHAWLKARGITPPQ